MDRCSAIRSRNGTGSEVRCQLWEGHAGHHQDYTTADGDTPATWTNEVELRSKKRRQDAVTAIVIASLVVVGSLLGIW